MPVALITGGSGFFGGLLKRDLLRRGWTCVNIDLQRDEDVHANLVSIRGDIRNSRTLEEAFSQYKFDAVFHCAAILAHAVKNQVRFSEKNEPGSLFLWTSNVEGTRNIADACVRYGVSKFIFTSSNCLWGKNMGRLIREDDVSCPTEIYGQSKWEAEKVLQGYRDRLNVVTIRCPTIVDAGRLGLLAILFEFIDEGRRVWVVGGGHNRYQFIAAPDLIEACVKALDLRGSGTFNIGADDVRSIREIYQYVIERAKTGARVASLPKFPTLLAMKIAYALKLSPLGPYQYKMIAEDFAFDTTKIKKALAWQPTMTNEEMLWRAYEYYRNHRDEISRRTAASAHRQAAKMGVIRLLKWIS